MKTTRQCPVKPDFQLERRSPLTINDARHPLMPWLAAGEVPEDYEDREYATNWALSHPPVESIGTLQAPSPAPERPRRDTTKKV
ncbi:hypothetical protein [Massilia sp. TSP1-1-2]|uniref:hypothetical protein n=1 Tax=Massilia sp. TSP1-1-2 TaxID=2804649 RepID=UPI003CEE529A